MEQKFAKQWIAHLQKSTLICGYRSQKMITDIEKFGGVQTAKRVLKRNGVSEDFQLLAKKKQLALSMEALITSGAFSSLFDDEEVNQCFENLCEYGYF
ncbi:hypothetical protein [Chakrabartyella piscis]|uniref:hypothetical protein n=1 Tax=Chakrabartyella piscis TaxID=2918914 RepID=UPI0029586350|nr:hypothetical protein [Chakrabartyella piscis]